MAEHAPPSSLTQLVFESQKHGQGAQHQPFSGDHRWFECNPARRPPVPFIWKTYEMVDDPKTDHIISWTKDSKSFVIWDEHEFSKKLLPLYFKHANFSNFIRQLNFYGFRKDAGSCLWKFSNAGFQRGNKQMLNTIRSRVKTRCAKGIDGEPAIDMLRQKLVELRWDIDGEPAIDMLRQKLVELQERVEHVKKLVDARDASMKRQATLIARRILEKRKRMRRAKPWRVSKRLENERKEEEEKKKDQPQDTEIRDVDLAWLEEEGDAKAWLWIKEWPGFEEEKMPDVDPGV